MTATRYAGIRVAIVGLGPAGAYAAGHMLSNTEVDFRVDVFEKLPTPWGLVRAGVAPDHSNIKGVTRVYEKTAEHPRFTYFGNVELGRHIYREDLLHRYHAVIYAVGTPRDRALSIPGEELPGSVSATSFVGWYNGHPDHRYAEFDLSCRRAIVLGNGNVALDVARILALHPSELARTDIADHALVALDRSRIEEIVVIGRRGPEQAAFTNPELRQIGELSGCDVVVDPGEVAVPSEFRELRPSKSDERKLSLLQHYAGRPRRGHGRRVALRFLLSPVRIVGERRVEGVELERNVLERLEDGTLRARPTGGRGVVSAGMVVRAVGYRGEPIAGVPFDAERGVIANKSGRVLGADGRPTREYVVGWAKRGPTGVIGTNKKDAFETVRALTQDLVAGYLGDPTQAEPAIEAFVRSRQPELITYSDWDTIDRHERDQGKRVGCPRVKLTRVSDMIDVVAAAERLSA